MALRRRLALVTAASGAFAIIAACVGDDPQSDPPPTIIILTDSGPPIQNQTDSAVTPPPPPDDAGPLTVMQVEAAEQSGCALLSDGSLWCWGDNQFGQLGAPPPRPGYVHAAPVPNLPKVTSFSSGSATTCAIDGEFKVWCWGRNTEDQAGHPPNTNEDSVTCGAGEFCAPVPKQVAGVFATQVSVGTGTVCVVTTTKTVLCWGHNVDGQAGADASAFEAPGKVVPGLPKTITLVRLAFSGLSGCALDTDKHVWCWGKNGRGQLGHTSSKLRGDIDYDNGTYNPVAQLVVTDGTGTTPFGEVEDIVVGDSSCAVKTNGTVWCWGPNRAGFLTLPADNNAHPIPQQVPGVSNAKQVRMGDAVCALLKDGHVSCWGGGDVFQDAGINAGCVEPLPGPTGPMPCHFPELIDGPPIRGLDLDHTFGVGITLDGGKAVAWGFNGNLGRLGHGPGDAGDTVGGFSNGLRNSKMLPIDNLP